MKWTCLFQQIPGVLRWVLGIALILVGIPLYFLPIPVGFLFLVAGLLMIACASPWLRSRLVAAAERWPRARRYIQFYLKYCDDCREDSSRSKTSRQRQSS